MERTFDTRDSYTYPHLDGIYGYSVYIKGHKPKLSEGEETLLLDILLLIWDYDWLEKRINNDSRI